MGIVGFGNIGRAIARRATGFEMNVLAVDCEPVPAGEGVAEVWPLARLNELCDAADVLVISAPITPNSRGMIGAEQLRRLKRGSYLLQMSRGGIVDEPALVDALEEGHLAGAGLDVTATEPLPRGDPLWTAPNLIITPHTSAISAADDDADLVGVLGETSAASCAARNAEPGGQTPRLVSPRPRTDRPEQSPDRSRRVLTRARTLKGREAFNRITRRMRTICRMRS